LQRDIRLETTSTSVDGRKYVAAHSVEGPSIPWPKPLLRLAVL
jgi:hypothetical protein